MAKPCALAPLRRSPPHTGPRPAVLCVQAFFYGLRIGQDLGCVGRCVACARHHSLYHQPHPRSLVDATLLRQAENPQACALRVGVGMRAPVS